MTQPIPKEKFKIVGVDEKKSERLADKSVSFWKEVWIRFSHNKLAVVGMIVIAIIALMAIFAPMLSPYKYDEILGRFNEAPSAKNWFGTDDLGRDVFTRIWYGARTV